MAGSRKVNRKEPEDYAKNWYWLPWSFESVQNLLIDLGKEHKQVILYGETFGNVQFLKYNRDNAIDFRAFDLFIDGTWVDYDEFKNICDSYGVPTVPLLARIPFSLEKVRELSEGQTMLNEATHIREGVVVKPVKERVDYETLRGRRVILKYVSDTYLLKNSDKDTTDI
jgi:RNA ligase (TIGR02306 family)